MAKIMVSFEEVARYTVEIEAPDEVAKMDRHKREKWLLADVEDNPRYFQLINEQRPAWATECCTGIENRQFRMALVKSDPIDDACLQESPEKKQAWLAEAEARFPPGRRVRVVRSDESKYIGQHGQVIDYDLGVSGEWPLIRVRLDSGAVDGFYADGCADDELVRL